MSLTNSNVKTFHVWLAAFFVGAIFLGGVWLGKITLPISTLILPVFFMSRAQFNLRLPPACVPLLVIVVVILIQFGMYLGNPAFRWKSDLAVWLPVAFAGLTIVALRRASISDRMALRSMIAGGAVTAAIMITMIVFVPNGAFLLPGQDAANVEAAYAADVERTTSRPIIVQPLAQDPASIDAENPSPQTPSVAAPAGREAFSPKVGDQGFYDLKNRARSFLGLSNYIAVFLVFLFAVTLFSGLPLVAAVFGILVFLTLSRFGIAMLVVVTGVYVLRSKVNPVKAATSAAILCAVGLVVLYVLRDAVPHMPHLASLMARFEYWRSGVDALRLHPIVGAPRSVYLIEMGYSITWNPHNSILWLAVNFGLIGVAGYGAYVWIAVREIAKAAVSSSLWTGVFVGMVALLAWSFEEIIVLTPAFELLLAAMYSLARASRRS
ncbi:O-antigen ligase family protein [Mesorhizobium sp. B4-1-4]|uniref:O-antigen ligase family protein n=1 Tax=Mesorhizobium sp. B4-1-4 TaxID=2589888 RepID=UPI00112D8EAE|nr:O-antigen ligase family protein [Mesorhizobium sp. B4-1-4]UCI33430.1 O-antigen ligase family protein [Mesorhizobium sp. B4-1-4]